MKKLILIIWGWKATICSGEHLPWITHEEKNELWLADIPDNIEEIADYIKKIAPVNGSEILIFLHESHPHNFTRGDRGKLISLLGSSNTLRCRWFSGGKDRIYFNGKNLFGIIGTNGNLASEFRENRLSESIISNLVLDTEKRIINNDHFDHVWNAYWETPKDHVYRLAESFNLISRSYEWQKGDRRHFLSHLRRDSNLWQQLHSFAGIPPADGTVITNAALEYNLDAYESGLGNMTGTVLRSSIKSARAGIKNLLENGVFDIEDCTKTISITYNSLFDLFIEIAKSDD